MAGRVCLSTGTDHREPGQTQPRCRFEARGAVAGEPLRPTVIRRNEQFAGQRPDAWSPLWAPWSAVASLCALMMWRMWVRSRGRRATGAPRPDPNPQSLVGVVARWARIRHRRHERPVSGYNVRCRPLGRPLRCRQHRMLRNLDVRVTRSENLRAARRTLADPHVSLLYAEEHRPGMCVPTRAERRLIGRRDELVPDDPKSDLVRRAARRMRVAKHRARHRGERHAGPDGSDNPEGCHEQPLRRAEYAHEPLPPGQVIRAVTA
jgi:hypothetical protein